MKKQIWSLALISLLILGCTSHSSNSKFKALTAKSSNLKEQILSLKEKHYSALLIDGTIQKAHEEKSKTLEFRKFFNRGNILERTDFYVNGNLQTSTITKLNQSNIYIRSESFDVNNKLIYVDKVIESTENSYVKKRNHLLHISPSIVVKESYENDLIISKISYVNDSIITKWVFIRDNVGKVLRTNIIHGVGKRNDTTIFIARYLEHDNYGNWIKRIDYNQEKPENIYVYERVIEYREK